MYQEFNDLYLKYKKFLPQKLAFKMAYKAIQMKENIDLLRESGYFDS